MFSRFEFHHHSHDWHDGREGRGGQGSGRDCSPGSGFGRWRGEHRHGASQYGSRGPKMFDAGSLRYVVLHLIAERPRHGYEIIKEIEDRVGGGYSPSPGVIYPILSLLEDLGHVATAPEGNKKLHTITPEGQSDLDQNRALVDGVLAQLGARGRGASSSGLREALHAVREALVTRVRGDVALSSEQLAAMRAALDEAAEKIRKI
jgi:DNA-binding PadR family transcriptional regulator